jgi:hypothetical protein
VRGSNGLNVHSQAELEGGTAAAALNLIETKRNGGSSVRVGAFYGGRPAAQGREYRLQSTAPGPVRHALCCIASHSCAMGYVGSAFHAMVSSVHA